MINIKLPSSESTPPAADADKKCCLCSVDLETTGGNVSKNDAQMQENSTKGPLVKKLFLTLQLQYADASPTPVRLCQSCMEITVGIETFLKMVKDIEDKLQKQQESFALTQLCRYFSPEYRPGVDGNPGVFVKTEDDFIIEVDPDANLDEDTEDDFSNESDTDDGEDVSMATAAAVQPSAEAQILTTTNQSEQIMQARQPMDILQRQQTATKGDLFNMDFVVKNTFLCQYCDMAFTGKEECSMHESMHNTELPFCCFFCRVQLSNRQSLIVHIKEEHGTDRPYICITCEKGFCRRSDLKKHTIVHTGVRPYTCPVCLKGFSRNTNLTKHMRIHTSVKPHVCLSCPRSFSTHAELMRHVPTHAAVKPHQCSMCNAAFTRRDKLALHQNSHYRKHPYLKYQQKARQLGAGMMYDANEMLPPPPQVDLNTQNIGHLYNAGTGDAANYPQGSILAAQLQQRSINQSQQPSAKSTTTPKQQRQLNCEICSRSFTREIDLQQHQALHLDTLFMCKLCNIGFSRREKLLRHEQEHHAPQYPCEHCYMNFLKLEELQVHLKMHELQRNVEAANHAAAAAAAAASGNGGASSAAAAGNVAGLLVAPPQPMNTQHSATAADFNFYSQLVPTMHLGFYSETNIEGQNGM